MDRKHTLEKFWGKKVEAPDTSVKVWIDESLKQESKEQKTTASEPEKNEQIGDRITNMGMNSQLNKEERVFKLVSAFNKGQIDTVQDAMKLLNIGRSTIVTYLRELDWQLYCKEQDKYVGGGHREPQDLLQYSDGKVKYYDGDPNNGGTEISQLEYEDKYR